MDDVNNKRPRSYLWLIILIVLAILVCLLVRTPDPVPEVSLASVQPIPEKAVSGTSTRWQARKIAEPTAQSAVPAESFYDKLDSDNDRAIQQLRRKAHEAKKIIPFFPDFPKFWLVPPREKGKYSSLGERYCIEFLELLFPGHKFIKTRPDWLLNPDTNRCLELDGYCAELNLAIEYNGIQHYVWPNFLPMSLKEFWRQRERDQLKEEVCIREHICLIRIPYTVPLDRIPLAVYSKLLEAVPGLTW
jgi:hypothetical protein